MVSFTDKYDFENSLLEKEKMQVINIFSFFLNVCYIMKDKFYVLSNIIFVVCECFQCEQVVSDFSAKELILEPEPPGRGLATCFEKDSRAVTNVT